MVLFKEDRRRFKEAGTLVLIKLGELRVCKQAVKDAVLELTEHSKKLISILARLDRNIHKMEARRKFVHTSGVAATTVGSSLAAALWAIAYFNEEEYGFCVPLALLATGVGIGGTVAKMGTAYICSRSNQTFIKELDDSVGSEHWKDLNEAERLLNSKFKEMIHLLNELYAGDDQIPSARKNSSEHPLLQYRDSKVQEKLQNVSTGADPDHEEAPLVLSLMETAESASSAPDVISTVLEYSSDLGFEPMEVVEQTYEAATASLGEVISYGLLEGAANGLSVVLSTYEIYRLVSSWNRKNPTSQKIQELISNVQKKLKAYNSLKRCIEIVDTFSRKK